MEIYIFVFDYEKTPVLPTRISRSTKPFFTPTKVKSQMS